MFVNTVEFTDLEKELARTSKSFGNHLANEVGKVYVVAVTRDGCPACEKQKPRLEELARASVEKFGTKVAFIKIHVRRPPDSEEESLRSKDVFGHYFYPTDLILVRTQDRGAVELYRSISPEMDELEKNIEAAVEIAAMMEKMNQS